METIASAAESAAIAAYFALARIIFGLIFVGLIWTPFAAAICLIVARARRLGDEGWGKAGAQYSLLFFLPWVWLVLRMAGVPIPAAVARAGFALLYCLWLLASVLLAGAGAFLTAGIGTEALRPDSTILIAAGVFAGAAWFASLRRTLRLRPTREGVPREGEISAPPSVPMRIAYAAMHVSWTLGAIGVFTWGIFDYLTFDGRLYSAIPLWMIGTTFALVQAAALINFGLNTADRWDYPRDPAPGRMPPAPAYITPFLILYLMIVIPIAVGVAGWILGVILWLS